MAKQTTKEKELPSAEIVPPASAGDAVAIVPETGTAVLTAEERKAQAMSLLEAEGASGFEEVRGTDLAMPFFKLLQSGSPEAKKSDAAYIKGAEEGMWCDVISRELFHSLIVVPCMFVVHNIEWYDRNPVNGKVQGNGLYKNHGTDDTKLNATPRNERTGRRQTDYGTIITPTGTWFCVAVSGVKAEHGKEKDECETVTLMRPCVFTFSSTAEKASRRWISDAQSLMFRSPTTGKMFKPPLYTMSYELETAGTKNDDGSWFLPVIDRAGMTLDYSDGEEIFEMAKKFAILAREHHKSIAETNAAASDEPQQSGGGAVPRGATRDDRGGRNAAAQEMIDDDIPF